MLFLTKTWGFGPETHPVLGFSTEAGRTNFIAHGGPSDWVVIAGTRGAPTALEEQGRLLGMCRLGRQLLNATSVLEAIGTHISDQERDEHGDYRWPWALPMIEARRFDPQPDTKELLGSYLQGSQWAAYALPIEEEIGADAVRSIWRLNYVDCTIHEIPELSQQRAFEDSLASNRRDGPSGPPPSHSRRSSERELGEGCAYAFKLVGGRLGAIKVGCAKDVDVRLAQLNAELRPALTGCSWRVLTTHRFPTETYAYNFEQALLRRLKDQLVTGETEVVLCSEDAFFAAWSAVFSEKTWAAAPYVPSDRS